MVFYIFILSWKSSWLQRIQSWKFKTLSWITNHDLLSRTLLYLKNIEIFPCKEAQVESRGFSSIIINMSSDNNKTYNFFERQFCWKSIFGIYCVLQALTSLTAIVKKQAAYIYFTFSFIVSSTEESTQDNTT